MDIFSLKSTLAFILSSLLLCIVLAVSASNDDLGPSVSSVEVVNHTKIIYDDTTGPFVRMTVGMIGVELDENIKIRPTSKVALFGSECYKNQPMKNIDLAEHLFKPVNYLVLQSCKIK